MIRTSGPTSETRASTVFSAAIPDSRRSFTTDVATVVLATPAIDVRRRSSAALASWRWTAYPDAAYPTRVSATKTRSTRMTMLPQEVEDLRVDVVARRL